jgi:hypothetical protein
MIAVHQAGHVLHDSSYSGKTRTACQQLLRQDLYHMEQLLRQDTYCMVAATQAGHVLDVYLRQEA